MPRPSHDFDPQGVLEALPLGVAIVDTRLQPLYVNARGRELLGMGDVALEDSDAYGGWTYYAEDGTEIAFEDVPAAVAAQTGKPVRQQVIGVRSPGVPRIRWLLSSTVPELGPDGTVTHLITTFQDISDAHEARMSSERLYRSVFSAMSEGVVVHATDATIRLANPAAVRVLGRPLDAILGATPETRDWGMTRGDGLPFSPDELPSAVVRRTGHPVRDVLVGVAREDGGRAWLSVSADPLDEHDEHGHAVVTTFVDVTFEHEASRALERSRERLESVLEAVPGAIYTYVHRDDGSEAFEFASARASEVFAVPADEMVDDPRAVWRALHPEDRPGMARLRDESRTTGVPWEYRFRVDHGEDEYRWVHSHAVPVPFEDGVRWTGVGIDVTEARNLEDRMNAKVQREAMGDLAAGVAHNFNNMLAAILPNIEMAAAASDASLKPLLMDARRAARSAGDLVSQLLALTPRGRPLERDEAVDAVEVIEGAVAICLRTFDRGITITRDMEVGSAAVRIRRSELEQIVLNLCLNSRDALEGEETPRIAVRLRADEERAQAVLEVEDNGHGIPAAIRERLGEPFLTTKEPGRGTGLGLATAYRAVQSAGGTVECASTPGQGTTFTIRLPLADAVVIEPRPPSQRVPSVGGRILLVEDEPLVRRGLKRFLRLQGFDCLEADRGDTAIELLDSLPTPTGLSGVFLDLSLPGLHGSRVLAHLRETRPELPVLILSGHIEPSVDTTGARRVLQKPVGMEELQEALRSLVPPAEQPAR